jgi:hypothetical protein
VPSQSSTALVTIIPSLSATSTQTPSASSSQKRIFSVDETDNLINNGYTVHTNNNTVYLNGTHIGYIQSMSSAPASSAATTSPALIIASVISALAALALLGLLAAFIRKRRQQKPRLQSVKDAQSFTQYLTAIRAQQGNAPPKKIFATQNNSQISNIQSSPPLLPMSHQHTTYSNPQIDVRKHSTEFEYSMPQIQQAQPLRIIQPNRYSTTLYQNKVAPHKKTMMPVKILTFK